MIVTNWQKHPTDAAAAKKYATGSPNIAALWTFVATVWGWLNLGIGVSRRPIRGGESPSDHWFGAAGDFRWYTAPFYDRTFIDREIRPVVLAHLAFLIEHHEALGVQRIHDYYGGRIWSADRQAWKDYTGPAFGESWACYVHVSTNADKWGDDTPITDRLGLTGGGVGPAPRFDPSRRLWGLYPLNPSKALIRLGAIGDPVAYLQGVLGVGAYLAPGAISYPGAPDGRFGPRTHDAVIGFQAHHGLVVDGIVGRNTWAAVDGLALATGADS